MSPLAGLPWLNGFPVLSDGSLDLDASNAFVAYSEGMPLTAAGKVAVTDGGAITLFHNGFGFNTNRLVISSTNAVSTIQNGFGFDSAGRLCVTSTGTFIQHGAFYTSTGKVKASVANTAASPSLWVSADTLAQPEASTISQINDISGNSHHLTQSTTNLKPTFRANQINGRPAMLFDGTNDYLSTAAFASPTAGVSVYAVVNFTVVDAIYRTIMVHDAAATWVSPFARVGFRTNGTSTFLEGWVEDATVGANFATTAGAQTTGWQILELIYDQTNITLYRNGTSIANTARVGAITSSTQPLFVGADGSLADNLQGYIAELLVYPTGHNTANRQLTDRYLGTKYNITVP